MKRLLFALASVLVVALGQTGLAHASPPPIQTAAQLVQSAQDAVASAQSAQTKPQNSNISVRVLSPGDGGPVTQENNSWAGALAVNRNDTDQTANESQGGGKSSGPAIQASGQEASNDQDADATAYSSQYHPENSNLSVRVLSEGDNGPVTQKNNSAALAVAANKNETEQTADQTQDGGYDPAVQASAQSAHNDQDADAKATSWQSKPKNENISVRVLTPGEDGSVDQENNSWAGALALNRNDTDQTATQSQVDGVRRCDGCDPYHHGCNPYDTACEKPKPCEYSCDDPCNRKCEDPCDRKCDHEDAEVQTSAQLADSKQDAETTATSAQREPRNDNLPVLVSDPRSGGPVEQRNDSRAKALGVNSNELLQALTQQHGEVSSPLSAILFGWFPLLR
jgi:hypothetical protein